MTPGRYRTRPCVIEAMRFDGTVRSATDIVAAYGFDAGAVVRASWQGEGVPVGPESPATLVVRTLEGEMQAIPGDWIIRGLKGELYPCKPDVFALKYEPEYGWALGPEGLERSPGPTVGE